MSLFVTIDNGGTFTDACLIDGERVIRTKTLTTPHDLTKCFIEVIKSASKELYGEENIRTLLSEIDYIRYSTTAGTNAIVQKKGPRIGLILREGKDPSFLLGSAEEQEMFAAMVDDRIVDINLDIDRNQLESKVVEAVNTLLSQGANRLVISLSEPNLIEDEIKLKKIILRKYPRHLLGAVPVLFSHELVDDANDSRRTWSALINSFLHPGMERFLYNAENYLRELRSKNPLLIFHNDGNSTRVAKTTAIKTYGSGPRGGMEGAKALAKHYNLSALLTLDIGGTTSDIGLVKQGSIKEDIFGQIEDIPTSFSLSDLISVGAGGSSIFKVENGNIVVGPESVGAAPGPACFARGGQEPTITDAYLLMGILDSRSYFRGSMELDMSRSKAVIEEKIAKPLGIELEEALLMMEKAYVEKIARGLAVYQDQADDVSLLAFGGAGPMSACAVARAAGIKSIIIPKLAAVFSAFGISFSDIAHEYQVSMSDVNDTQLSEKLSQLEERAKRDMFAEGFDISECKIETHLSFARNGEYQTIAFDKSNGINEEMKEATDIRLHLKVIKPIDHYFLKENGKLTKKSIDPANKQTILHEGKQWKEVPVYRFEALEPGTEGVGPALIEDELFTCRILEGWSFKVNENKDIFLTDEGRNG